MTHRTALRAEEDKAERWLRGVRVGKGHRRVWEKSVALFPRPRTTHTLRGSDGAESPRRSREPRLSVWLPSDGLRLPASPGEASAISRLPRSDDDRRGR